MKKHCLIKNMNVDSLSTFLSNGGFCPELMECTIAENRDDELEPFFDDEAQLLCEVQRDNSDERMKICTECIKEFLEEEADAEI